MICSKHKIGDLVFVDYDYDVRGLYLILDMIYDGFKFQDDITLPTYLTLHIDSGTTMEKLALTLDKYEKVG